MVFGKQCDHDMTIHCRCLSRSPTQVQLSLTVQYLLKNNPVRVDMRRTTEMTPPQPLNTQKRSSYFTPVLGLLLDTARLLNRNQKLREHNLKSFTRTSSAVRYLQRAMLIQYPLPTPVKLEPLGSMGRGS